MQVIQDQQLLRKKEVEDWLNNKVTRDFLSLVLEHRDASKELVSEIMLNAYSLSNVDLNVVSQHRGQVFAMNQILDIEDFIREKVEVNKKDEEVYTGGASSSD